VKSGVKCYLAGFLTCVLLLGVVFANNGVMRELFFGVNVTVDGTMHEFDDDMQPFIMDGRTFLPVRGIAEALNASVNWDDSTNTVQIESPSISFLSIFTNADASAMLNFDRIDAPYYPITIFFDAASFRETPYWRPYVRVQAVMYDNSVFNEEWGVFGGSSPIETTFALVVGNQAIYSHNGEWETRVVFTLLPNGNIRVDEYGVDFGLSGEYQPSGMG